MRMREIGHVDLPLKCSPASLPCPQVLAEKRQLGSKDGPPHQVLLVPLHERVSLGEALQLLRNTDKKVVPVGEQAGMPSFMLLCPQLKHRWFFTSAKPGG